MMVMLAKLVVGLLVLNVSSASPPRYVRQAELDTYDGNNYENGDYEVTVDEIETDTLDPLDENETGHTASLEEEEEEAVAIKPIPPGSGGSGVSMGPDTQKEEELRLTPTVMLHISGGSGGSGGSGEVSGTSGGSGTSIDLISSASGDFSSEISGFTVELGSGVSGDFASGISCGVSGDIDSGIYGTSGDLGSGVFGDSVEQGSAASGELGSGPSGDIGSEVSGASGDIVSSVSGISGDFGSGVSGDPSSGVYGDHVSGISGDLASGVSGDLASGVSGDLASGTSESPALHDLRTSGDFSSGPSGASGDLVSGTSGDSGISEIVLVPDEEEELPPKYKVPEEASGSSGEIWDSGESGQPRESGESVEPMEPGFSGEPGEPRIPIKPWEPEQPEEPEEPEIVFFPTLGEEDDLLPTTQTTPQEGVGSEESGFPEVEILIPGMPTCLLCICLGSSVYCDDVKLESVPPLPKETTHFYARYNKITKINKSDFAQMNKLKRIDLTSNDISRIDDNALFGLPALEELIIRVNRVTFLPALPPTMTLIDASHNRLGSSGIQKEAFKDMAGLLYLYLTDNNIDYIPVPLPDSLRSLHLQNNNVQMMHEDTFCNLKDFNYIRNALEDIRLDGNPINLSKTPQAYVCLPRIPIGALF
ncbi:epiphycan isoform X1 [Denticeps clupeoides]|uniref:epiphycan isoform X1 n=1 Tax=Denticeps clupeoides TaxID=299321 RepID=UPI0010A4AF9D|nr:epiphycan isoform X1 [Denticeps clupeoides]XP_028810373.1 epiphycan isoform X1 [Denticeps clupeoides]